MSRIRLTRSVEITSTQIYIMETLLKLSCQQDPFDDQSDQDLKQLEYRIRSLESRMDDLQKLI